MPFITLSKSERRRLTIFFSCLGFAVMLWLFFALSNKYDYVLSTQVKYINFPQNKAFHPLQPDTVDLHIKGTGWQLMFSRILNVKEINVNLQDLRTKNFITFKEQLNEINSQFESNQQITYVSPDTLYFDFSARTVKKVPVKLAYDIRFKPQFGIAAQPVISPQYVVVTGPVEEMKKINYWLSDSVKFSDIGSAFTTRVALRQSSQTNVDVYPTVVDAKFPVEQFTENVVEVPLKVLNNKSYDIKLLPEKIKVRFLVALSNYPTTDRESFEAAVDLNNWSEKNYHQLPVRLARYPAFCKIINIEPQTVDFFLKN